MQLGTWRWYPFCSITVYIMRQIVSSLDISHHDDLQNAGGCWRLHFPPVSHGPSYHPSPRGTLYASTTLPTTWFSSTKPGISVPSWLFLLHLPSPALLPDVNLWHCTQCNYISSPLEVDFTRYRTTCHTAGSSTSDLSRSTNHGSRRITFDHRLRFHARKFPRWPRTYIHAFEKDTN